LERLIVRAAAQGAEALYATQKVELDGEEMRGWEALGFSPCETVEHHELPLDQFEPQLAPLYERMRQRGWIPDSARIIPLTKPMRRGCDFTWHSLAAIPQRAKTAW
jgi:hypothetical protein